MSSTTGNTKFPEPIYHDLYYPRPKSKCVKQSENETNIISPETGEAKNVGLVQTSIVLTHPTAETILYQTTRTTSRDCFNYLSLNTANDFMAPSLIELSPNTGSEGFHCNQNLVQYSGTAQFSTLFQSPEDISTKSKPADTETPSSSTIIVPPCSPHYYEEPILRILSSTSSTELHTAPGESCSPRAQDNCTNQIREELRLQNANETSRKLRKIDDVYRTWCKTKDIHQSLNFLTTDGCENKKALSSPQNILTESSNYEKTMPVEAAENLHPHESRFISNELAYENQNQSEYSLNVLPGSTFLDNLQPNHWEIDMSVQNACVNAPSNFSQECTTINRDKSTIALRKLTHDSRLRCANNSPNNTFFSEYPTASSQASVNSFSLASFSNIITNNINDFNDLKESLLYARDEARKSGSQVEEDFLEEWMSSLGGEVPDRPVLEQTDGGEVPNRPVLEQTDGSNNFDNFLRETESHIRDKISVSSHPDYNEFDWNPPVHNSNLTQLNIGRHFDNQNYNDGVVLSRGNEDDKLDKSFTSTSYDQGSINYVHYPSIDSQGGEYFNSTSRSARCGNNRNVSGLCTLPDECASPGAVINDTGVDITAEVLDMSMPHEDVQLREIVRSRWFTTEKPAPTPRMGTYKRR